VPLTLVISDRKSAEGGLDRRVSLYVNDEHLDPYPPHGWPVAFSIQDRAHGSAPYEDDRRPDRGRPQVREQRQISSVHGSWPLGADAAHRSAPTCPTPGLDPVGGGTDDPLPTPPPEVPAVHVDDSLGWMGRQMVLHRAQDRAQRPIDGVRRREVLFQRCGRSSCYGFRLRGPRHRGGRAHAADVRAAVVEL